MKQGGEDCLFENRTVLNVSHDGGDETKGNLLALHVQKKRRKGGVSALPALEEMVSPKLETSYANFCLVASTLGQAYALLNI